MKPSAHLDVSEQQIVIGIDALFAYEGGDRMRDRSLRQFLTEKRGRSSSIITPTMIALFQKKCWIG
ncbi:hypothetical protein JF544_17980 [Halobacillus kuroshimensis]|uniref:Transposase n=1 Tax=Halobacillus kuroshimensis TaxID=302481 RepID=A0ABS3E0Q2_9BACI|nr:hypothetical protein [Halobacillus kuroshimensis]MBN8237139.1 hypothetical protein [Halobacillus kuroshimensis]